MKKSYYHILLVGLLLVIPIFSSPDFDGTLRMLEVPPFQREFIRHISYIMFFYLHLYVLLPNLLDRKKYLYYFGMVFLSYLFIAWIPFEIVPSNLHQFLKPFPKNYGEDIKHLPPIRDSNFFRKYFSPALGFLFAYVASFFIYQSKKKQELESEKAKSDLLNLKYQLQPHFLFNILNSIYSLSLMKSDAAPEGILKLSNVMRYVVTESGNDFVPLGKEIDYIKDYIALQLIRTDESLDFSFSEKGDFENYKIAPLILVNFVENAFKYGFNAEEKSKIEIDVVVENDMLVFKVFNQKVIRKISESITTQIGLQNTLLRLESIYGNKYNINIDEDEKIYRVHLKIDLK